MMKSSQHQASVKYFRNPYAQILTIISNTNMTVNTLSSTFRVIFRIIRSSSSMLTSSTACVHHKHTRPETGSCSWPVYLCIEYPPRDRAQIWGLTPESFGTFESWPWYSGRPLTMTDCMTAIITILLIVIIIMSRHLRPMTFQLALQKKCTKLTSLDVLFSTVRVGDSKVKRILKN